jgi:eukaryotic-like serine/threonine-protein kinase
MSLRKYLFSFSFVGQVLASLLIVVVVGWLFIHWLTFATNHGEVVKVPNVSKLSEDDAEDKLNDENLEMVLLDTLDYNPAYAKLAIVEQFPLAGSQVKEGRKIYVKINANSYAMVAMPDLVQKTYRQAVPTLSALGLKEGTITYEPNIGKDMVLEMKMNGQPIKAGTKVMKSTKIDLVLGDGMIMYEEEVDSLGVVIPADNELKPADGQ